MTAPPFDIYPSFCTKAKKKKTQPGNKRIIKNPFPKGTARQMAISCLGTHFVSIVQRKKFLMSQRKTDLPDPKEFRGKKWNMLYPPSRTNKKPA
jgi:hypothetical protein